MESDINGIKTSDPKKGALLSKALVELRDLTKPADVKQKASEMLKLLD